VKHRSSRACGKRGVKTSSIALRRISADPGGPTWSAAEQAKELRALSLRPNLRLILFLQSFLTKIERFVFD
jgi:hypothetical protein